MIRKDRINLHKWLASLGIFVLTASLAGAMALKDKIGGGITLTFVVGWALLAASMVLNGMLINGYVRLGEIFFRLLTKNDKTDDFFLRRFRIHESRRVYYDVAQKWSLIFGASAVACTFVTAMLA